MPSSGRSMLPYGLVAVLLAALAWAASFGQLPPADFTFNNETEIKSVDPAIVTGNPEGRIIRELFEGLVNWHPQTLEPIPGVATHWELADDLTTYTFHLRPDARWSDGSPVTAQDFHWSYRRFLHPDTAAEYAYQLFYVQGAEQYTKSQLAVGDAVEVELDETESGAWPFAQGRMVYGKLLEMKPEKVAEPKAARQRIYRVQLADGGEARYSQDGVPGTKKIRWLLPDFRQVGIEVVDDLTLIFRLKYPVPYFVQLVGFYPLSPVQRKCVERFGYPAWTKPENIVSNGPFVLSQRRIRDRIRLVKNPHYWDAQNVHLNIVDALAIDSDTTALNLYLTGKCDWVPKVPTTVIHLLQDRPDFVRNTMLTTYFYRLNVTKPPLDDIRVRQALNLALDKAEICEKVARGGEMPARSLVPPGLTGYEPSLCGAGDPAKARQLLAEAGYPQGRGFPRIEILYNTAANHRSIAELIQAQWKQNLGIDVGLVNQEWAVYLDSVRQLHYGVARSAWTGDYFDPNTFLDMFVTDGENNQTGFANADYDRLISAAQQQRDPVQRMATFRQAEAMLMEQMPVIPIYFYVSSELVNPSVHGFHGNLLDMHPLSALKLEPRPATPGPGGLGLEPMGR